MKHNKENALNTKPSILN